MSVIIENIYPVIGKKLDTFPTLTDDSTSPFFGIYAEKTGRKIVEGKIYVRTYERGVEDETYSCGTGVVASAISSSFKSQSNNFKIKTKGGNLEVHFDKINEQRIENIWLIGPATHVFDGNLKI